MPAVNFSREAGLAIIETVHKVRAMRTNLVGDRNVVPPQEQSFWAWLSSPGGLSGLYWSWLRVQPVANLPAHDDPWTMDEPPLFELATPRVAGYLTARESSGNRNVRPESIVRLHFVGVQRDGQPQFAFSYGSPQEPTPTVPLHDHRDNDHGGFAFSVYHPGTSLPQQRFAV